MTKWACGGWKPVSLSSQDKLTRKTKEDVVAHNEYGERQGCWSATK